MLINTTNSSKSQILVDSEELVVGITDNKIYLINLDKKIELDIVIKPNFYYHVVVTYNTQINLFVNGFSKTIEDVELNINNLFIGMSKNLTKFFSGILGAIQIFNEELNKDQICEIIINV